MKRPTSYRTNLIILVVVTLGLVSLGMKLPNLLELASSSAKPKPRPRAVIKTQIKSCQESIEKIHVDVSSDGSVRNTLAEVSESVAHYGSCTSISTPLDLFVSNTLSRAPPSHS